MINVNSKGGYRKISGGRVVRFFDLRSINPCPQPQARHKHYYLASSVGTAGRSAELGLDLINVSH